MCFGGAQPFWWAWLHWTIGRATDVERWDNGRELPRGRGRWLRAFGAIGRAGQRYLPGSHRGKRQPMPIVYISLVLPPAAVRRKAVAGMSSGRGPSEQQCMAIVVICSEVGRFSRPTVEPLQPSLQGSAPRRLAVQEHIYSHGRGNVAPRLWRGGQAVSVRPMKSPSQAARDTCSSCLSFPYSVSLVHECCDGGRRRGWPRVLAIGS